MMIKMSNLNSIDIFKVQIIFHFSALFVFGSSLYAQSSTDVTLIGQMKDVMWKGELHGKIHLDTIKEKKNLYGLGPVEYLSGEVLIINGKSYKSTAVSGTTMKVEETYNINAPFFGYANIPEWREQQLPDSIRTVQQLERYLNQTTTSDKRPFMFRLAGIMQQAKIHVVNLPKGAKVSSPAEAHQGQVNYKVSNEQSDIIGFFSTEHKAIFTHHDSFLHMHLITADRKKMGHLDEMLLKKGTVKLYLPR